MGKHHFFDDFACQGGSAVLEYLRARYVSLSCPDRLEA